MDELPTFSLKKLFDTSQSKFNLFFRAFRPSYVPFVTYHDDLPPLSLYLISRLISPNPTHTTRLSAYQLVEYHLRIVSPFLNSSRSSKFLRIFIAPLLFHLTVFPMNTQPFLYWNLMNWCYANLHTQ